ncbi:MAG TPA: ABC transporter permease [Tepidisphaeraceae bacterium]|jgi:spermidine/putrescine transport system permease protein
MPDRLVSHGQLVTRRRLLWRGAATSSPGVLWLLVFLAIPCLLLLALAFASRGSYGQIIWSPTWRNFRKLAGYGVFGWSADYLWILARTVWLALLTTILCILLAYPIAFFVARRSPRWRNFWLVLLMIPFCTNLVIRTYGWQLVFSILSPNLYPGAIAVIIGMVSSNLSFAVLPLYTSVERIDWSIVDAAEDLYASRWSVFRHGILPQTRPGLVVAVIVTFIPALGTFVVPDLLGGSKTMLIGNLIQQQFGASRDFPFGAALSFTLMLATLIALGIYQRRAGEAGLV